MIEFGPGPKIIKFEYVRLLQITQLDTYPTSKESFLIEPYFMCTLI